MSNQNIPTPWNLFFAVEKYFHIHFKYDMAASKENAKCGIFFTEEDDSLSIDWPTDGWIWLNPTFVNLTKWINKCKEQKEKGCRIISIWPFSCDLNQIVSYQNANEFRIFGRVWPNVRGCVLYEWCNDLKIGMKNLRFQYIKHNYYSAALRWKNNKLTLIPR
jgi:hypothetical protein